MNSIMQRNLSHACANCMHACTVTSCDRERPRVVVHAAICEVSALVGQS